MISWNAPARPSEYTEAALVAAILDGDFPPGTALPGERTLAAQLGVTRPTLREAIQRLARDGWLTVAHGKPTVVNDYWVKGGLNVLGKMVERPAHLPPDFIPQLLEVRQHLAPAYTRLAISRAAMSVADLLAAAESLDDTPAAFARFDWHLHQQLTILSGNPIFTLILNGFQGFYEDIAQDYFARVNARSTSAFFYKELRQLALASDPEAAAELCRYMMQTSVDIWRVGENGEPS